MVSIVKMRLDDAEAVREEHRAASCRPGSGSGAGDAVVGA